MIHSKRFTFVICTMFLVALLGGCASSNISDATNADGETIASNKKNKSGKKEAYSPVGEWAYEIESPQGANTGTMVIEGSPGTYEVVLKTDQFGEIRIYDLDMTGQSMLGKVDIQGVTAELEGDFDGEDFSGAFVVGDQVFPIVATRIKKG